MADTPTTGSGGDYTSPKGGRYGGLVTAKAGADLDTLNTNAVLAGMRWTNDAAGTVAATSLTYYFPTSATDYTSVAGYPETTAVSTFSTLTAEQKLAVTSTLNQVASYTNVTFSVAASGLAADASLRFAQYAPASPGSEANFPANNGPYSPSDARAAGDNFEGQNAHFTVGDPILGTDAYTTIAHELGHSIGLKHGHDASFNGALSADRNDSEFSIMTYASYIGGYAGGGAASEARLGSGAQSFMMYDIAALQYLYGANFSAVGTARTYSWDKTTGQEKINGANAPDTGVTATNKIFSTVWNEGAATTYDVSNFSDNGLLDLRPGFYLHFSDAQIADLNSTAAAGTAQYQARGNIYNALTFNGDKRSLVANIKSGSGNDTITGNDADNIINPGAGNNRVDGGAGVNTIDYSGSSTKAFIDIGGGYAYHDGTGEDRLSNIQNIIGTNLGDRMYGTAGNNVFTVGSGSNIVYGEGGADTIDYSRDSTTLYVDLGGRYATHDGVTDYLIGISSVTGNNASGNRFYGTAGDNVFKLGSGSNIVYGEGGSDTADYSRDTTTLYVDLNARYATHDGVTDYLIGLSSVTGNNASGNRFYGTSGNNLFTLGTGANIVYGQGGSDTVDYSRSSTSIYADISSASNVGYVTHDGVNDALVGIANVIGSAQNDRIYGARNGSAQLAGGAGDDVIYAFGGANRLDGGTGNDKLVGSGNDSLTGGAGADAFIFSTLHAADTITDFASAELDKIYLNTTAFGTLNGGGAFSLYSGTSGNVFNGLADGAGAIGFDTSSHDLLFRATSGATSTVAHMGMGVTMLATADITLYTS